MQAPVDIPAAAPGAAVRPALRWHLVLLALAFVVITGALTALSLAFLRTQAMDAGRQLMTSLSHIIGEQTTRTLQTVDQRLQLTISELAQLQTDGQLTPTSAHALLKRNAEQLPFVRAIWMLDAQGRIQYDSDVGNLGISLADRAYFQIYQSAPATTFHVGAPVRSRSTGTWLISASRPIWTRTGEFKGVVVAAIEPPYFDQVWRAFDLGPGGSVALLRHDGVLMTRAPFDDAAMGQNLAKSPLFSQHLKQSANGTYQSASLVDGVPRIFAYQTLATQPEMLIVVGESERFILAPWRRLATTTLIIWALATGVIVLLMGVLARVSHQRALAQAEALTQAQRLALATEAAAIGVWDWYINEPHWYGSPIYFSLLGEDPNSHVISAAELLTRVHPDDQAMVSAKLNAVLAGSREYDYEARLRHRDGNYRWIKVIGRVLADDDTGQATRLVGVRTDITERKLAEQALQESEARHRQLFESSPLPLWVVDLDTTGFVAVNDAALRHYGYSREEFLRMTLADIRPAEDEPRMRQEVEHLRSTAVGHHAAGLWRHRCKDGRVILVEITTNALMHQGRAARLVLAHDVTAREQAQAALRQSEENLNITLQSIGDAVMVTDTQGRITRMNPAAERLTAWSWSDALGRPLTDVFRIINAKTRAPAVDPVQVVMSTGKVVGLANHTALLARDGQEYQIFDSAAPMHDAQGQIMGVVLVFSDVTESYRVREALDATTELLERTGELARVGGWELDLRTKKITVSDGILRMNEEDTGTPTTFEACMNLYAPEFRPQMISAIQNAVEKGQPFDLELPRTTKSGRPIWHRVQGVAVFEDGKAIKIQGASQDITKRKLAEIALQDSETRFRNLVEWMPEAIMVHRDGIILYANPAAVTLFGATSAQQLVGHAALDRVHPDERPQVVQRSQTITDIGQSVPLTDIRLCQLDGTIIEGQVQGTRIMFDGAPAIQAVMRDVSARKRSERLAQAAQQALYKSAQHTQTILDNLMDGVITIDTQGTIASINQAACALFGYTPDEVMGRNVTMLLPEPHQSQHDRYLQRYLATGKAHIMGKLTEVEGLRKDGSLFPMSLQLSEVVTDDTTTFIGIVRDITQHRQDIEEIRRLAFYDPLTELPNRRLLLDRLRQAMRNSARSQHHGALMFLDLDHFKQLNDTQGHDIGDLLLKQVAKRIQHCAREGDSLARLGGDEFVVLLENLSPHESEAANQAELIADKITEAFITPFSLRGHDYDSSPSIGIVVFQGDGDSMDELLKKADVAMYQAKAAGRNTARFYDPAMQAAVAAHDAMEREMRIGLANQEFVLHFQPQFSQDGSPIGAEALVRWQHPERGLVAPGEFIALAEETGLIQPLGQWVLEAACAQLVLWSQQPGMADWTLSVNVSAVQFAQADYVATVVAALQSTGANPNRLKLELTESMLANDVNDVVAKMHDLKARGCSLSLDDFGTGYSSLAYLKRMPLDQIKIDQSFVRNVLTDASDAAIVKTILALGRSMKLQVIAEGVETQAQRDFLAQHQCDAYQGYYFGRPMPAGDLLKALSQKGL